MNSGFIYRDGWFGSDFAIARRTDTIKLHFKINND